MPKITTEKEFLERAEHCAHCLEKKFKCEPGHRAIVLCGETGCLANGSQELLDEFLKLIKENKLEDKVTANIVSCFGYTRWRLSPVASSSISFTTKWTKAARCT